MICDMQQTVDRIVAASKLPLSIVIVGVGGADFSNMVQENVYMSCILTHLGQVKACGERSLWHVCTHSVDIWYM